MKIKVLLIVIAVILMIGCAVGGTVAWLVARASVVNVFTVGEISLSLTETTGQRYHLIPGETVAKNPKVTVYAGSEDCWLFVKLDKGNDPDAYITYAIADGWTELESGVYYREQAAVTADVTYSVLQNDRIVVRDTLTQAQLAALKASDVYPTLSFTAYAVQKSGNGTVGEAWNIAKGL